MSKMNQVFSEKNPWDGKLWNHGGEGNIKQKLCCQQTPLTNKTISTKI